MDQADNDSKTQLPTERRQSEALERGQVARSPELQVVAMLAAALGVFSVATATSVRDLAALSSLIWGDLAAGREPFRALPVQVAESSRLLAFVLAPVVLASLVAALLAGGLQTGFQLTPKALGMRFERLNPVAGFTRMFSRTTAIHGLADFGKTVGIGVVLWFSAQSLLGDPLFSAPVEAAYLGGFLQRATLEFLGKLILALGVIAALSYAYERHRNFQEMKMTHQEVKEEHKQSEGDAFLKGAMRRMARRLMQRQMLDADGGCHHHEPDPLCDRPQVRAGPRCGAGGAGEGGKSLRAAHQGARGRAWGAHGREQAGGADALPGG